MSSGTKKAKQPRTAVAGVIPTIKGYLEWRTNCVLDDFWLMQHVSKLLIGETPCATRPQNWPQEMAMATQIEFRMRLTVGAVGKGDADRVEGKETPVGGGKAMEPRCRSPVSTVERTGIGEPSARTGAKSAHRSPPWLPSAPWNLLNINGYWNGGISLMLWRPSELSSPPCRTTREFKTRWNREIFKEVA